MLGVMLAYLVIFLDPMGQLNKGRDSARMHDIGQIRNSLDVYYNDTKCYPASLSVLSSSEQVYMKTVPKDPTTNQDYAYVKNGSCPQWMVLFTQLSKEPSTTSVCPLSGLTDCLPAAFDSTWACVVSGNVDCAYVASYVLPSPTPTL